MLYLDSSAKVHSFDFADDGVLVPNSPLPVVIYRGIAGFVDPIGKESRTRESLSRMVTHHHWRVDWVEHNAIFRYPHYHSTAHEVLLVMNGSAVINLGGEEGDLFDIHAGDAVAIPAGVAHQRISRNDDAFVVAGLYRKGSTRDLLEPTKENRQKVLDTKVPFPAMDPFWGEKGPLTQYWK